MLFRGYDVTLYLFSVLCPAVEVENGSVYYNTTAVHDGSHLYPTTLHIHCHKGFLSDGPSLIHCQEDGNWSHTVNECTGKTDVNLIC